jgi:hypothetical protein
MNGQAGPVQPTGPYILYTNVATWPVCVSIYYFPSPVSQETIDFATQVWTIAVVFLIPPKISVLIISFTYVRVSAFTPPLSSGIFHFCPSLASVWLQKGMAVLHLREFTQEKVIIHDYLLLISKDQAHKLFLDMFDFLHQ